MTTTLQSPTTYPPCPTSLTADQLEQYRTEGYLAFTDVLSPEEVQTAKATIAELVVKLYRDPETRRDVQLEPGCDGDKLSDSELELKVRKLTRYRDRHPFFADLTRHHPRMRGVVESIIGPKPLLYLNMALLKPPFIGTEKPWHQDDAYFLVSPLEAICGVWIALDAAGADNGCMQVIPGGHKIGPLRHIPIPGGQENNDCTIATGRLDPAKAVNIELPPGGGMLFSGMLPHRTPPNNSPLRRRAIQYHYRAATSTILDRETFNRMFVESDGTPATCEHFRPKK